MEMVRAASGETMFYNANGPKNEKDQGRFADKLKKPDQTDLKISVFFQIKTIIPNIVL